MTQCHAIRALVMLTVVTAMQTGCARGETKPDANAGNPDQQSIQGTWKAVLFAESGLGQAPSNLTERTFFVFDGNDYAWITPTGPAGGMEEQMSGAYTLDTSTSPRRIDFHGETDILEAHGIYKFTNDTLVLHFNDASEDARPSTFQLDKSKVDNFMLILKRSQVRPKWRKDESTLHTADDTTRKTSKTTEPEN